MKRGCEEVDVDLLEAIIQSLLGAPKLPTLQEELASFTLKLHRDAARHTELVPMCTLASPFENHFLTESSLVTDLWLPWIVALGSWRYLSSFLSTCHALHWRHYDTAVREHRPKMMQLRELCNLRLFNRCYADNEGVQRGFLAGARYVAEVDIVTMSFTADTTLYVREEHLDQNRGRCYLFYHQLHRGEPLLPGFRSNCDAQNLLNS